MELKVPNVKLKFHIFIAIWNSQFDYQKASEKFHKLLSNFNFKNLESMALDIALEPNRFIDCSTMESETNSNKCSKTKRFYGAAMQVCYEIEILVQQYETNILQYAPRFYKTTLNIHEIAEAFALQNLGDDSAITSLFKINIDNELANFENNFEFEFKIGSVSTVSISAMKLKMLNSASEPCTQKDTQVKCIVDCIQMLLIRSFDFKCQVYVQENFLLL